MVELNSCFIIYVVVAYEDLASYKVCFVFLFLDISEFLQVIFIS